jgi:hypothetical protein
LQTNSPRGMDALSPRGPGAAGDAFARRDNAFEQGTEGDADSYIEDLGAPLARGSMTPTMTSTSTQQRQRDLTNSSVSGVLNFSNFAFPLPPNGHQWREGSNNPHRDWHGGNTLGESDDEDYGQPIDRSTTANPLQMSNRL